MRPDGETCVAIRVPPRAASLVGSASKQCSGMATTRVPGSSSKRRSERTRGSSSQTMNAGVEHAAHAEVVCVVGDGDAEGAVQPHRLELDHAAAS